MEKVKPLSTRVKMIQYEMLNNEVNVIWGNTKFHIENNLLKNILESFFISKSEWYILGASATNPAKNGLGESISLNSNLTLRHASAIMYNEGLIDYKGIKPIEICKK